MCHSLVVLLDALDDMLEAMGCVGMGLPVGALLKNLCDSSVWTCFVFVRCMNLPLAFMLLSCPHHYGSLLANDIHTRMT